MCAIKQHYIKFPCTEQETIDTRATFEDLSDLPNVVGAIDGTHIKIKTPNDSGPDYFSRYRQHDVVVQAVTDGEKRFLDIAAGFPGSMHDSRVLRNSNIYQRIVNGELLQEPTMTIENREIKPYLVGDSAYPLSTWLLKPYPETTNNLDEIEFNKELSRARVSVECAFGILKSRWRILQKRLDSRIDFATQCIVACCVLHNFCMDAGDPWDDNDPDDNDPAPFQNGNHADGEALRDFLKDYIWDM